MKNYARIIDNVAIDVSRDPAGSFHPDIAKDFVEVPTKVQPGWTVTDGTWAKPAAVTEPDVAPAAPTVGVIHFKMMFTSEERVKSKALRSQDEALDDFWSLVEDPRTDVVDLSLPSVQGAIEYTLGVVKAAGVDVDVPARKAAILSGVLV